MQTITTIGLDIAKSVFQVHGVDAGGQVIIRRQLKRRQVVAFFQKLPPCLIGIEACASSHHWSRELQALGHTVRLMPPAYVKPYVKRQKNDMADAEAICEAVTRANMRFVPTKTPEQQSGLMLHRTRHMFIRQQTAASAFYSARKFHLWVPDEHVYQLPDASFLCEYFRCVGKLLEDGQFDKANREALSWQPFLDNVTLS